MAGCHLIQVFIVNNMANMAESPGDNFFKQFSYILVQVTMLQDQLSLLQDTPLIRIMILMIMIIIRFL